VVGLTRRHTVGELCDVNVLGPPTGCHAANTLEWGSQQEVSLESSETLSKRAPAHADRVPIGSLHPLSSYRRIAAVLRLPHRV
jgi:hypothetical protein